MEKKFHIQQAALLALSAPGFESQPGYCWRWCRQVLESMPEHNFPIPPRGVDAKGAFRWYERRGFALPPGTVPQTGDLLFKVSAANGKHGHVGIFVGKNRVAENSSAHVGERDREARGMRTLLGFGGPVRVVRVSGGAHGNTRL